MKSWKRILNFFRRRKLESEMADEMRHHLEEQARRSVRAGMPADEAAFAARREFGNVVKIQESAREARGGAALDRLAQDVRHAARGLWRSPGFSAICLLTIALGTGVNTTSFSVLNALLFHTPSYPEPERLVRLNNIRPRGEGGAHSPANFLDYRAGNTVFEHLAAARFADFNLAEPGQPADRMRGMVVTADFFPMLRGEAQVGRTFSPEEDRPGAADVVVLSHRCWQERFGGDRTVVGRSVRIDGEPVTIVGVMPAAFDDHHLWGDVRAWRPMGLADVTQVDRDNTFLRVMGRLKPGLTVAEAQAGMDLLSARLAAAYPETNTGMRTRIISLVRSAQDSTLRRIAWLVTGLAGIVLLIACANLANLQFARNAARAREYAIRVALGAPRIRLVRLVLTECLLLSLAGGGLGLVLAQWTNQLAARSIRLGEGISLAVAVDGRVLGFSFALAALSGVGFGLLPAWLASRSHPGDALKLGGRNLTSSRSQHRLRRGLIVLEVALALTLLTGAGLFARGLREVLDRDVGWETENLVAASLSLRGPKYETSAARGAYYRQLHERLAALPGVDRVAISTSLPTAGYDVGNTFVVEGQPPPEVGRAAVADVAAVTPGYFETLGIRLLQGRDFSPADQAGSPAVVLINETMARRHWPGENPVGKRIGGATPFMSNPREIIGVVSDVRAAATLDDRGGRPQFYRALAQWSFNSATIALRSRHAPEAVERDLRRVLAEIDPDQALYRVTTIRREIDERLTTTGAAARVVAGFAGLGLMLAALGLYGLVANSVAQRTTEIGVRMALGARERDILVPVVGDGLRLAGAGAAVGLLGAFGVARFMRSLGPEFAAGGPGVTAAITVFLLLVALAASWIPARRAARIDPLVALRAE
ncbi:MAG TPA: ABC transporter permease [Opitutaceae bacterium]|nr:ABC transporter permease [Opitutaceae bacterium]